MDTNWIIYIIAIIVGVWLLLKVVKKNKNKENFKGLAKSVVKGYKKTKPKKSKKKKNT